MTRQERIAALKAAAKERILILDGSWGVMIQRRGLEEADYRGDRFTEANYPGQMKGNNDILCITRPDIVTDLQRCENAWCADLQSSHTKILNFMHTSLKPMRSSYGHDPHTLFAARRRSAFSALSGSGAMVGNEMRCHCWPQRARP